MLKLTAFVVVLTLSCFAFAQQKTQQEAIEEGLAHSPDATTTCQVTFASGTGENATKFCITQNGNIAQFSRFGVEMIAVGAVGEGYLICDLVTKPNPQYYDYGYEASPNWLNPTFTHNGNTVTVTRLTSDGVYQLNQTFLNIPATATSPASVKITMALKNLSGTTRDVFLLRYADVDASDDGDNNDFSYTSDTAAAFGFDEPAPAFKANGLMVTLNTSNADQHYAFAQNVFSGPSCATGQNVAPHPFNGDGSIVAFWFKELKAKTALTAVSTYKPI